MLTDLARYNVNTKITYFQCVREGVVKPW